MLVFEGGKLVAMGGLLKIDGKTAKSKRLRVHPEYQGRGLAKLVLTELEASAKKLGFETITADCIKGNAQITDLNLKMGFKMAGEQVFDGVLCTLFEKKLN